MKKSLSIIILFLYFTSAAQQKIISIADQVISIPGRKLEINTDGFPKQIQSDYHLQDADSKAINLLYEPIHFHYYSTPKAQIKLNVSDSKIISASDNHIAWNAISASTDLEQKITGEMLANGVVKYKINVKALKDVLLHSINFHIPFEKSASKYLSGLNEKAGLRADTVKWTWSNGNRKLPEVWIGTGQLGLYLGLSTQNMFGTAAIRNGWINDGNGKLEINIKGSSMLAEFTTGNINLKQGDELIFDFNLVISEAADSNKGFNPAKKLKASSKLVAKAK